MLNYAWLIPLFPFLTFWVIILIANPWKRLSSCLAIGAMFLSFLVSLGVLAQAIVERKELAHHPFSRYIAWMPTAGGPFRVGYMIDPLAAATVGMVSTVCLMIFIYSVGYMHGDPRYSRFFAYISLFATGMLGMVISSNLLEFFLFWELMGLCSYLLIGFWFERPAAANAGKKAFLTTKIGDVILFLGIALLYSRTGSLEFEHLFSDEVLHELAEARLALPALGAIPVATVAGLMLFGGTVGKSAQFPLHVWLPDAMEGPTPVSALIHAATMVAAGVYLVARAFPIFAAVEHPTSLIWVAGIGAFTALFASTIAVAQDDIKRVLAYSTISQLGYMVMGLGIGGFVAGAFHLITHAFFKALLFLGSGSVIHGSGKQDMMEMGGLRRAMPRTFWTFLIGALSLAGIPPLAGFWSKDEILADAFLHNKVVWMVGTLAAFITAFYMARQVFLTFFGEPRDHKVHAHESPAVMTYPLIVLALFAIVMGLVGVPEDFPALGPLLGHNPFHSFVGHYVRGIPEHYLKGGKANFMVMGLSIVVALTGLATGYLVYGRRPLHHGQPDPLRMALGPVWLVLRNKYWVDELYGATVVRGVVAFAGLLALFDAKVVDMIVNLAGRAGVAVAWLLERFDLYVVDGLVNLAGRVGVAISWLNERFDTYVVDGLANFLGDVSKALGRFLRLIQTGKAQDYLLIAALSVLVLVGMFLYW